jgi:hypothetical protein
VAAAQAGYCGVGGGSDECVGGFLEDEFASCEQ